jgi:hypothetical protein
MEEINSSARSQRSLGKTPTPRLLELIVNSPIVSAYVGGQIWRKYAGTF